MGLLDDAIREHLELKRRHGADPGEVARQESEALGPARRAAETAEARLEVEPESDFDLDPESEPAPVYEAEPEAVFEPEPEPEPEPVVEPEPEPEPVARHESTIDQPTVEHPAAKPEPLSEDDAEDAEDSVFGDDASQSDASSERVENEDGDVLEGTPEFLEETPEHDRLWFEQRPPRDFDFDD
jgi:hypothetical protein